jgi:hypothetical protein
LRGRRGSGRGIASLSNGRVTDGRADAGRGKGGAAAYKKKGEGEAQKHGKR